MAVHEEQTPKLGIDDYFASGGTVEELISGSKPLGDLLQDFESALELRCTDVGNGERMVERYGAGLRYVKSWGKWLHWDGARWATAQDVVAEHYATATVMSIDEEVTRAKSKEAKQTLRAWATRSQAWARIRATVSAAAATPSLWVDHDQLDSDPWLLNVANGTLDLRSGELRPHRREDLITQIAAVGYDAEAECPLWLAFLDKIFSGDVELIACLQRLAGYSLTGVVTDHVLPILFGNGRNGKTTFCLTLQGLLGDYAAVASEELLLASDQDRHPTEKADLFRKRMVVCSETDSGRRLSEALVKNLTGGEPVKARRMGENFWEFLPTHKLYLVTNSKPEVRGTDEGIWSRIMSIPFEVFLRPEERDAGLGEKLKEEGAGILRWAAEGCREWQKRRLSPPEKVRLANQEYRHEMDVLGSFLADRCEVRPGLFALASELYRAYVDWCHLNGERRVQSQTAFGRELTRRGFEASATTVARLRRGLALRDGEPPEGPNPSCARDQMTGYDGSTYPHTYGRENNIGGRETGHNPSTRHSDAHPSPPAGRHDADQGALL